ncbi:MAG TPA: glycosyltransferase family 39 protein, partial [Terriglobales bacterium]|nr:glycosyltransferase family 39 protein [Terriglobales bacterium]
LLILGFALRFWNAAYRFLNADEALHFLLSMQSSAAAAYRASFTTVHPPLLIVFLHYWGMLGRSELFLRLPSVIAGTGLCWVMFCWLKRVTNRLTALIALALLLFSPALIQLSAEVRQYAFLLLFCATSLYFFDRAIEDDSASTMALSLCSLYLAMLTHYSSLIFALTLGIYSLLRIFAVRPRIRVISLWLAGQVGALALIAFLFVTHVTKVQARHAMQGLVGSYLRRSVLQAGENPLGFVGRACLRLFHYFFSQGAVGAVALVLFICGIVLLVRDHGRRSLRLPSQRQLAFLLTFPLVVNCVLALFRAYPFGGTRHDSYLAIFVVPGIAITLSRWRPRKQWWKPLVIGAVLALCNLFPSPQGEYIRVHDQSRKLMAQAVASLHSLAPGSTVFTDDQGGLLLSYYACDSKVVQIEQKPFQPLFSAPCGDNTVISLDPKRWTFKADTFQETLLSAQHTFNLSPGAPLWFFQAGWFIDKEEPLRDELKRAGCKAPMTFGRNIFLCRIRVP